MNSLGQDDTVIVVGAGIVGIACAHYLTKAGLRVTVIDKGTTAGACSHANCGYVNVNSLVYGKLYFPVMSNGLKALALMPILQELLVRRFDGFATTF